MEKNQFLKGLHLILDIDGTLVDHKSLAEIKALGLRKPDFIMGEFGIFLRPGVVEFIDWSFKNCKTVSIFTASKFDYAFRIMHKLLPQGCEYCFLWDFDNCIKSNIELVDGIVLYADIHKPLSRVWNSVLGKHNGIHQRNSLIVDDIPNTFALNKENGIHIPKFMIEHEKDDDVFPFIKNSIKERYQKIKGLIL